MRESHLARLARDRAEVERSIVEHNVATTATARRQLALLAASPAADTDTVQGLMRTWLNAIADPDDRDDAVRELEAALPVEAALAAERNGLLQLSARASAPVARLVAAPRSSSSSPALASSAPFVSRPFDPRDEDDPRHSRMRERARLAGVPADDLELVEAFARRERNRAELERCAALEAEHAERVRVHAREGGSLEAWGNGTADDPLVRAAARAWGLAPVEAAPIVRAAGGSDELNDEALRLLRATRARKADEARQAQAERDEAARLAAAVEHANATRGPGHSETHQALEALVAWRRAHGSAS